MLKCLHWTSNDALVFGRKGQMAKNERAYECSS